jgi:uncharacterized protein DUF903
MTHWTSVAALLAAALALGCASPYTIYLRTGETLYSTDEPSYDEDAGFYRFEDQDGREQRVNKDQIERMEAR